MITGIVSKLTSAERNAATIGAELCVGFAVIYASALFVASVLLPDAAALFQFMATLLVINLVFAPLVGVFIGLTIAASNESRAREQTDHST